MSSKERPPKPKVRKAPAALGERPLAATPRSIVPDIEVSGTEHLENSKKKLTELNRQISGLKGLVDEATLNALMDARKNAQAAIKNRNSKPAAIDESLARLEQVLRVNEHLLPKADIKVPEQVPASPETAPESAEVRANLEEAARRIAACDERLEEARKNLGPRLKDRVDLPKEAADFTLADYKKNPTDLIWKRLEERLLHYEQAISNFVAQEQQGTKEQTPVLETENAEIKAYIEESRKKLDACMARAPREGEWKDISPTIMSKLVAVHFFADKALLRYEKDPTDDSSKIAFETELSELEEIVSEIEQELKGAKDQVTVVEAVPPVPDHAVEEVDLEKGETSTWNIEPIRNQLADFANRLTALEGAIDQNRFDLLKENIDEARSLSEDYESTRKDKNSKDDELFISAFMGGMRDLENDLVNAEKSTGTEKVHDASDLPEALPESVDPEGLEHEVYAPETRRERKQKLGELIAKVVSKTAKDLITEKETEKQKDERERREGREERLERIASEFAAELGVTSERDALIAARKELFDAEKEYAKNGYAPDDIGELRRVHNDLALAYTQKLDDKAAEKDNEQVSQEESGLRDKKLHHSMRGRAALVRIHDTVRTLDDMRARAREEVRQEQNGKLNLRTPLVIASKALTGYNALHDLGAQKYVDLVHVNKSSIEKKELAQKIAHANKLVTAAAVTSFVFGGASIPVRVVRSMIGGWLGGKAAEFTGEKYDQYIGDKKIKTYEDVRMDVASREESLDEKREKLEKQQQAYGKANKRVLQKERQIYQFGAAILAGGLTSAGTTEISHLAHALNAPHSAPITNLSSVKGAVQTLHTEQVQTQGLTPQQGEILKRGFAGAYPESANTGNLNVPASQIHQAATYPVQEQAPVAPSPAHAPTATATPEAPKVAPTAPTESYQEVRVTSGTGADKMFSNLHKIIDDHQAHSHLVDKLINEKPHLIAQRFGFPDHNANGYMQPGDSVKIENHQLVFHRGDHAVVLMHENPDGSVTDNPEARAEIQKLTSHHHHLPQHHETARTHEQAPAQEKPAASEPPKANTPTPPVASSAPVRVGTGDVLPSDIDPNSAEAADYYMRLHNPPSPSVPSHTTASPRVFGAATHEASVPHEILAKPAPVSAPESHPSVSTTDHQAETLVQHPPASPAAERFQRTSPWVNVNREYIDPRTPALHDWKMPGTKKVFPVFMGGSEKLRSTAADVYLLQHPEIRRILVPVTDPGTGRAFLQLHQLDPISGRPIPPVGPASDPVTNTFLPEFDPDDLIPHK